MAGEGRNSKVVPSHKGHAGPCPPEAAMRNWVYLFVAILAETFATSALKSCEGFTRLLPSAAVLLGYSLAFYCLSLTLRTIPVGVAYAVWSGVGIVLVTVAAWILYGQKLDAPAMAGIGLITAGVLVMNVFSKAGAH
jgi:small multidrug resistance pump